MDYLGAKISEESLAAQGDIPKLYTATGDNEDGTMTQKAITDELNKGFALPEANEFVEGIMYLYNETGSNTDGTMTQKAITEALSGGGGGEKEEVIFKGTIGASTDAYDIELPRPLGEYKRLIITSPTKLSSDYMTGSYNNKLDITNIITLERLWQKTKYTIAPNAAVTEFPLFVSYGLINSTDAYVGTKYASRSVYISLTPEDSGSPFYWLQRYEDWVKAIGSVNKISLKKYTAYASATDDGTKYIVKGVL